MHCPGEFKRFSKSTPLDTHCNAVNAAPAASSHSATVALPVMPDAFQPCVAALSSRQRQQLLDARGRVPLLHQRLAHQDGAHAGRLHKRHVLRREDAALTRHHDATLLHLLARHAAHERGREAQVHLERAQVAVVDAQQVALHARQLQHARQLALRVHLDQALHAQPARHLEEVREVAVGQHGGDEQDGVRARRARLVHLVRLHDELLAQQRAGHARVTDEREVGKGALEELLVGEHAQACRAARLVRLGDAHRVKVGLDDALGG
mmetsp:Transcript_28075/g.71554  ORF Transcript_28075/g.71554 Transcript_28075/m.71554 type:complete len:265 (+) Transcript_28075:2151-2945(+)